MMPPLCPHGDNGTGLPARRPPRNSWRCAACVAAPTGHLACCPAAWTSGWMRALDEVRTSADPAQRRIVYLHGGAWINQISPLHWQLILRPAADTGSRVLVPNYHLATQGTAASVVPQEADLLRRVATTHGKRFGARRFGRRPARLLRRIAAARPRGAPGPHGAHLPGT